MENLVQRNEKGMAITNSLLVAKKFGKEHKNVIRDIENLKKDVLNFEQMFIESTYPDSYNRDQRMYIMNRDGFTLLAMGFTGERAMQFKLEYIEAFNKMDALLNSDDYIVLRSLKILDSKVKLLESENARKDEIIEIQHETINELAPDARYTKEVLMSKDVCTTSQIAKELGMSAKTLNKRLNSLRIQYKVGGQWVLYAKYQNKYYTKTHTHIEEIDGQTRTWHNTVWTEKGRKFIHETLKEEYVNS